MHDIELITTGGTIEKTYDEADQSLRNSGTIVHRMLRRLQLPDVRVHVRELFHKDSTELTDGDREQIVRTAAAAGGLTSSVVVLHGTDTLALTGRLLHERRDPSSAARVVLTGAMRPFEMKRSDALQNLTEAIFASTVLTPGVYCVFHGRALRFPNVEKDRDRLTFVGDPAG